MPTDTTNRDTFIEYFRETVRHLVAPLEKTLVSTAEFRSWPYARQLLFNEFVVIALHFAGTENEISDEEVELIWDIHTVLEQTDKADISSQHRPELRKALQQLYLESQRSYELSSLPRSIRALQVYDAQNNTSYAEEARTMYFRLASFMAKADRRLAKEEETRLSAFKEVLWPPDSSKADARHQNMTER